ncbi:hypothetical protein VP01_2414g1 [Puccinia sorghi]|uniref:Uncharacterized protein n=1 Tax=Puccinia sorghi TaxID=27349 RepID=A0A0L6V8G2_9BASI|nr:hypothetical protein VP01_2414g1 [Puccinia sorghi]
MLFRKASSKISKSSKTPSRSTVRGYDSLLGITYFDINQDLNRQKGATTPAACRESNSTTPLCSSETPSESTSPRELERSFVLIGAIGLPVIDLSDVMVHRRLSLLLEEQISGNKKFTTITCLISADQK